MAVVGVGWSGNAVVGDDAAAGGAAVLAHYSLRRLRCRSGRYGCLVRMRYAINLWIRLPLSHPFFKHDYIMYFVALGIGAVKFNRARLSIT